MAAIQRNFQTGSDLQLMLDLSNQFPNATLHVTDLPYRFSSWALEDPLNAALWFNSAGQLIGWAVLQTPFWTLDYAFNPETSASIHPAILEWADQRARLLLPTRFGHPVWFVNVFENQHTVRTDLEQVGFSDQSGVEVNPWSKIWMVLQPDKKLEQAPLPPGFTIRPLAGLQEVDAYVELHQQAFESKNMTTSWRKRILIQPVYRPDLDLVVTAPGGKLAAFCIGWFNPAGPGRVPCGQIEPLGVLPAYHRQGLGRAVLSECLHRLRNLGARKIFVETDNDQNPGRALYEKAGFQTHKKVLVYRKNYA